MVGQGRLRFVLKRVGRAFLTLLAVITISFGLTRLVPGSPQEAIRQQMLRQHPSWSMTEINEQVERLITYNPDKPIEQQYLDYMFSLLQGDFGVSIQRQEEVAQILAEALPWTLFLLTLATLLTFVVGIAMGALMAYREGTRFDVAMTGTSVFLSSVPYYVFALVAVFFVGYQWQLLPTGGTHPNDTEVGLSVAFVVGAFRHAALPVLSLVITGWGSQALSMRGNSIRVLGEDFMRVGRLRGLSDRRLSLRYVTHNAILPMYTGLMISIGFMFGGAVIVEEIFSYTGVGWYMLQAIEVRDFPLMMGGFVVITIAVIVSILFADLTYGYVDPRIGTEDRESYGSAGSVAARLRRFLSRLAGRGDADLVAHESEASFGTVSETEMSRGDRARELLDLWIMTPARIIWGDWRAKLGFLLLGVYVLMGTVGVRVVDPVTLNEGLPMVDPFTDAEFPFGTDIVGRDIFAQTVHATPPMLKMILSGSVFATVVGTILGTVSGYQGGRADQVITGFTDVAMTIPGLPLIIVLAATFKPSDPWVVGILLTINAWAGLARTIRSQVLTLRDESYVEASRVMGVSTGRIVGQDIIPNIMPYVLINFVQSARGVIFSSVGLYFLGVLPFSTANWGVMLQLAYDNGALYTMDAVHWLLIPMVVIIGLSLSLILIAQGMDRLFNPRLRARHAKTIESEDAAEAAGGGTPAD